MVYCGDYELLSRSYGISGASGKHPTPSLFPILTFILIGRHCCLWCHIMADELKLAPSTRGALLLRSDGTLAHDLAAFKANGSNIKRAKFFNNVIREPLFTISVDKACESILIMINI